MPGARSPKGPHIPVSGKFQSGYGMIGAVHEMKFLLVVLLSASAIVSRAEAQSETWQVRLESSGYLYARCGLEIGQYPDIASTRLECVPNMGGARLRGQRQLSPSESATIKTLVESSDFYGGGHTGFGPRGEDADFLTLFVRCCGRQDLIAIVVSGNRTFEQSGSRRELLEVFRKLREDLAKP